MPKPTDTPDLGMAPLDLMAVFPATLSELKVTPSAITRDGDSVTVRVTWIDVTGSLK